MFRTAEPFAWRRKTIYPEVLLIIAFCLIAHFLVEDVSLQRGLDASSQGRSTAGLAFDEIEHQDDLAMAAGLPEAIPRSDPPTIPAWSTRLERQSAFPIRKPPKIA